MKRKTPIRLPEPTLEDRESRVDVEKLETACYTIALRSLATLAEAAFWRFNRREGADSRKRERTRFEKMAKQKGGLNVGISLLEIRENACIWIARLLFRGKFAGAMGKRSGMPITGGDKLQKLVDEFGSLASYEEADAWISAKQSEHVITDTDAKSFRDEAIHRWGISTSEPEKAGFEEKFDPSGDVAELLAAATDKDSEEEEGDEEEEEEADPASDRA